MLPDTLPVVNSRRCRLRSWAFEERAKFSLQVTFPCRTLSRASALIIATPAERWAWVVARETWAFSLVFGVWYSCSRVHCVFHWEGRSWVCAERYNINWEGHGGPEASGPPRPTVCISCLDSFKRQHFAPAVRRANARTLRKSHHEFWSAIIAFITADANIQNKSVVEGQLRLALRRCRSCNPARSFPQENGLFTHAFNFLCDIVRIGFEDELFSAPRLDAPRPYGHDGLWPAKANDIMSYGPSATFANMLRWFMDGEYRMVYVLRVVFAYGRADLMPVLLVPSTRRMFVAAACAAVETAYALRKEDRQDRDPARAQLPVDPAETLLFHVLGIMECIASAPPDEVESQVDTRYLLRGLDDRFLKSLRSAAGSWGRGEVSTKLARIADSTEFLLGTRRARLYGELPVQLLTLDGSDIMPACRLHRLLLSIFSANKCTSPFCGIHARDLRRKPKRCASCMVFRYCSRDCQRSHWPVHKRSCASLKEIFGTIRAPIEKISIEAFGASCLRTKLQSDPKWAAELWEDLTSY